MEIKFGVYKWTNKKDGKMYIGSGDIHERFKNHKNKLKNNNHYNIYFQRAWNKYGERSFKFEIIIICGEKECRIIEQEQINFWKPTGLLYNINDTVDTIYNPPQRVSCFTQEGIFIEIFKSAEDAARRFNTEKSTIHGACNGRIKMCRKMLWAYEGKLPIVEKIRNPHRYDSKMVYRYDKNKKYIDEYESMYKASKETGISIGDISLVCNGKRISAGGFYWTFTKDKICIRKKIVPETVCRKVDMYKNNVFIKRFRSLVDAAKEISVRPSSIGAVCMGRWSHVRGYVFKYA